MKFDGSQAKIETLIPNQQVILNNFLNILLITKNIPNRVPFTDKACVSIVSAEGSFLGL